MVKKHTWRDVTEDESALLGKAIHRPSVHLAASVGRFETPFEYLKSALGGFVDGRRFLLNKTLAGDIDALAVREFIIAIARNWLLDEPHTYTSDLEREWGIAHDDEFHAFARRYYPWVYSMETASGALLDEPNPAADAMLDHYICEELAEYGFTIKMRKFKQNYWRCHSSLLSRRITISFDKGTYLPSTKMTGELVLEDFGYRVALGNPFFFSGCTFLMSMADQLEVQMERFFSEYIRIFPHVVKALEEGIAAADDVLAALSRKSVS